MFSTISRTLAAGAMLAASSACLADGGGYQGPPFDFSDAFYLANGIDPATVVGRPTGTGANSVIDNRENGPKYNNVRVLAQAAAYDNSGHPIFFYVTGRPSQASFTANSAGQRAMQAAERYKVYEFPRDGNAQFAAFPKAQDLIADTRNGYFSNDPLGVWQVNLVRFTSDALNTPAGQAALAAIAAHNGVNLDGKPLVKTMDEIELLRSQGYITIDTPPATAGRWFFCPVIEDPRNGAIAADAHLNATGAGTLPAAAEFTRLFDCLQTTGRECGRRSDCNEDGHNGVDDVFAYMDWFFGGDTRADFDDSGHIEANDIFVFLNAWFAGV